MAYFFLVGEAHSTKASNRLAFIFITFHLWDLSVAFWRRFVIIATHLDNYTLLVNDHIVILIDVTLHFVAELIFPTIGYDTNLQPFCA